MATTLDTSKVHLGHWINWLGRAVRGSTITLTRDHVALLTAFVAIFVGYAGARDWRIFCFSLHLGRAQKSPATALYHQKQAILRHSGTGDAVIWDFLMAA
jgi:hypothetical protein